MELIVEEVSRSQKLLQRHQIKGSSISIGRGFDNDVILNDPYICANHLSLSVTEEGRWQVCDQASVNGSFTDSQKPLKGCQPIHSGDVISIGKSHLRFIYPHQPVAPAIRLSGLEGVLNWLSSPLVVTAILFIYIGLLFGDFYLQASAEIKTSQMLKAVFSRFIGMALIPLMFSAVARLLKHDARVLTQMVVFYSFFIIFMLFDVLGTFISFNSNQLWISNGFSSVTQLGLIFALLWSSFYVAFHQDTFRRTMMAASFTLGVFLLGFLYNSASRGNFNPKPVYDNTLLAPEFAISSPVSIKAFIAQSESVFDLSSKKVGEKED